MPVAGAVLDGSLALPNDAAGMVVFVEGTGNGLRLQSNAVAQIFNKYKLATLMADRLSPCDITARSGVLGQMTVSARAHKAAAPKNIGFFSRGEGAAAALLAAARHPDIVKALVLQGSNIDQSHDFLPLVKAPVLFIAGGRDGEGLRTSQQALEKLNRASSLNVVPRASRSFEEIGTAEEAAELAALWFLHHLE